MVHLPTHHLLPGTKRVMQSFSNQRFLSLPRPLVYSEKTSSSNESPVFLHRTDRPFLEPFSPSIEGSFEWIKYRYRHERSKYERKKRFLVSWYQNEPLDAVLLNLTWVHEYNHHSINNIGVRSSCNIQQRSRFWWSNASFWDGPKHWSNPMTKIDGLYWSSTDDYKNNRFFVAIRYNSSFNVLSINWPNLGFKGTCYGSFLTSLQ